ncbi:MAG: T9SS type A sorting domain-containing protein [Cryomorphaceae bacterium]|nr:T9SS type A sorting domain-containing protein [Cryomorphaceae bacterium]
MTLNRDTSLTITENGIAFSSAFSGGINAGQFSEIDLNLDGKMDLVVFDKSGNKISPFINDNGNYIYAPKYRSAFPKLHDWMLLADYNCDGKNDIYTYSSGGMAIYENTSSTNLSFSLITSLVLSNYGSNNLNIYISPVDIPAIADIDYDGDLDILTFSILGGFVEYHKNMAMELTGNCDTVAFEFSESCWGLFYEGLNSYILNCPNCQCPPIVNPNAADEKQKHAGSTLLAIDIDNDNDMDLVLGDVSYNNLNLLINGGDNQNALMISVDSIFPQNHSNTIAADMHVYPATYYLDVTNDGVKDLIVTTNSQNNSENFESSWLYKNAGQTNNPDFNFVQTNFLQSDMIDLGKSAFPTFYDYNNDSLLDLVVGNYGYHVAYNDPISSLALFENTGTKDIPKYDLIDRDWQGISTVNLNTNLNIPVLNISPTFGDLDGDGDKDMLLGDADGELHYFNNQAGNFNITLPNYFSIDVGYFSQPQLVDVDRDGLLDIIIGEQDGSLNYCPNSGTVTNAAFDTIIKNWGGIDVDTNYFSSGYSSPKLIDSNGVYQLFVGSYTGTIYQFTNIDGNLSGQFLPVYSTAANLWDGGKCAFALADINNDNQLEMILGNLSGGIAYFSSDTLLNDTSTTNTLNNKQTNFSIYPNPANGQVTIESSEIGIVKIINLLGKTIYKARKSSYLIEINTSKFAKGIYILQLNGMTSKVLIQ